MFDNNYRLYGKHAIMMKELTSAFYEQKTTKQSLSLFVRMLDVFIQAPIIGFLYGRRSNQDTNRENEATIMYEQIAKARDTLRFNYRLIMILDTAAEADPNKRVDKAFKKFNTEDAKEDEERYYSYLRGGIELLYEKLIENVSDRDEYIRNLYDFICDFHERFNEGVEDIKF